MILGIFFTLMSGGVQFVYFRRMFRVLFPSKDEKESGHITSREALFVSVGGRVGGGNIAGVAVAITLGGPGAVSGCGRSLWSAWQQACSSAHSRSSTSATDEDGTYRGGPASYIQHGLGDRFRWLAIVYAVCLIAAFAFGFNAFQGNTVAGAGPMTALASSGCILAQHLPS